MRTGLLLITCLVYCCKVSAQQFTLSVNTIGFSDTTWVYLKKYYGRSEVIVDSIKGNSQTFFHVNTQHPINGLYVIETPPNHKAELIINVSEKPSVQIDYNQLKNGIIGIAHSPENEAYQQLVTAYLAYDSAFYTAWAIKANEFDTAYLAALQAKSSRLMRVQQQMNAFVDQFTQQHKGTYSATTLAPLLRLPLMDTVHTNYDYYPAFLFRHFWDNTNFLNTELLCHFLFSELLKKYFRHWVPKYENSIKEAIDTLQLKAAANQEVLQYINTYLLRNFLKSNAEDLALYVNKNANTEACELNLSEAEKKKFERLKSLSVGQNVPEILLPNIENNKTSLTKSVTANKATILLFWSSHCGKCRVELPQIQALYQKYKTQGLEVFAVNIDENKFNWRDAVSEFKLDWINVTDEGKIADSKVLEQFNIQHTPSLFLIAKNGKIFSKEIYGKVLEKNVQMLLSPSNK
ncbi:MAG TPA: TlpA disulfide reductase family protein [Chitinophagales bacterium]|nr:TlpA disulfide reductase family protein [Chitinophagales bacterium]